MKGEEPNLYLRIVAMKEIPVTQLAKYYVATTAKTAEETLPAAKATFMFLIYNKRPVIVKKHRNIKPKVVKHDPDTCKFQRDGLCGNKYCVNYEYECLHPRLCVKRKD